MQRPIVIITFLFICGIYLGYITNIPIHVTIGAGFLSWVICFLCLFSRQLSAYLLPSQAVLIIAIAIAYYDCRTDLPTANNIEHVLTTRKSLHRITGIVVKPPVILDQIVLDKQLPRLQQRQNFKRSDYKVSFTVRVEEIETAVGWKKVSGFIKVNLYLPKQDILDTSDTMSVLHRLIYGQRVELFGYVFLPKSASNPGEFDYKSYLHRQMPSVRCLMTVVNTNNVIARGTYHNNWIYSFVYALNNYLNNTIYAHTFSNSAPLISSMLLGNRVDLSGETIDNFMKTGIIHFIAISGFNVGIVVFTVLIPLRLLGINQILSTVILMIVVILYAFLTGLNPPVLRASIMVIVFLSSFLVRRQWDITSGISTAILFIIIRNPSDLFDIGFQLSVLATMGIIYGTPKIEGALFKTALFIETLQVKSERGRFFFLKKYLRKSLCVSLAAWLATLPLTAYYFHLFTPFISIINILVFPLFWIIIVCGIVLLTLGTICPPLAAASAWLASNTNVALESLVSALSSLPFSHFYVVGPSQTGIVIYYLFILLLLYRTYLSLDIMRIMMWGLFSANILVFSGIIKFPNRSLTVTCLDVGHGSAIFIQFPNGKNILYDAGSWQNYDVGRYIISPFLWDQNIKIIDLVVLSHEHEDHWNGLASLIERFSIRSVYSQPHLFASEAGRTILHILKENHIRIAALSCGEVLTGFEPIVVKVLNPAFFDSNINSTNDNSCVLKIEYLGHSMLLCADIQEQGIESILSKTSGIKSNIIQVPHHGSFMSNLERLFNTVQPKYAFINSSEGTVSYKTLDVLQKHHVKTLQTHLEGAVTFKLNKNGIEYSPFSE